MSNYFYQPYNGLPNFYGDAYVAPNYAAWQNYTVPFFTYPGWFYDPHYYAPRNDASQVPIIPCKMSDDHNFFCPEVSNFTNGAQSSGIVYCDFGGGRKETAPKTLAECQMPMRWPTSWTNPAYVNISQ